MTEIHPGQSDCCCHSRACALAVRSTHAPMGTMSPVCSAMGMKPSPQWLQAGDVVTLGIAGLGEQKQKVVPFKGKR